MKEPGKFDLVYHNENGTEVVEYAVTQERRVGVRLLLGLLGHLLPLDWDWRSVWKVTLQLPELPRLKSCHPAGEDVCPARGVACQCQVSGWSPILGLKEPTGQDADTTLGAWSCTELQCMRL